MEPNIEENSDMLLKCLIKAPNWGDAIAPYIFEYITSKKPTVIRMQTICNQKNYITVGSVLNFADNNSIVWGTGFISDKSSLKLKPLKICSVRGPLTRKKLIKFGLECPQKYGDPALLFPLFYKPKNNIKKYKLGIIPHFIDQKSDFIQNIKQDPNIFIINIKAGVYKVINQINCCEAIVSSSLHGIIAADAYKIPSMWIKISNKVTGEGFKFADYFKTYDDRSTEPFITNEQTSYKDLINSILYKTYKIDFNNILEDCPFKK